MTLARDEQLGLPQPRDFDPPDLDLVTSKSKWDDDKELSRTLPESQQPSLYDEDLRLEEDDQRELSGIRVAPPTWRQSSWFLPLESWQGHVLETHDDTFTARLITSDLDTEEDAEFDLDEIASSDRALVVPGAVFYWNVGYRIDPGGRRSRTSLLTFRRLPAYSQKEITAAEERAASISAHLNWLEEDATS